MGGGVSRHGADDSPFTVGQGMVNTIMDASGLTALSDPSLAAATIVWNYVGEIIFNMLVLVGAIKMSGRLIRELMGLG